MKRKKVISRLTTLVLAMLACLLIALLAPAFLANRPADEPFAVSSVMASPRDMHVILAPIQLSQTPDLVLSRGTLFADGNAAAGAPISRFVLDTPVLTLNASGFKASGAGFEDGIAAAVLAPLVEQLTGMGFDTLSIQHGTLNITTADGSSETLNDVEAELTGRRKGVVSGRGSFKVRGHRLKFEGSLAQIGEKSAPLRWPVKASLKSGLLEASLDGFIDVAEDLQISGQADISMPSLRRAARWFGVPVSTASGLNAAAFKGQFTWARRSLAVDNAKVIVDGNEGSGALTLNVAGERPLVDGTLAFNTLDLAPYLAAARSQSYVFERVTSSWSEYDLVFPIIKHVDADLRLSAAKITAADYVMGRGAAAITVRAGKLIADIAELELPGGHASGQVSADSTELIPHYGMRGRIENFEAGSATAALFGSSVLSGRSTVVVDLTARGQTPLEVLRGLSGKATLTMPEGGRLAMDVRALRGLAKTSTAPGWGPLAKGQANLDQVEARVVLQDGMLIPDAMRAVAGSMGLGATGRVDIVEGRLDLDLAVKPNVATDRPLTQADLAGAETVNVRGLWGAPFVHGEDGNVGEPHP